MEVRPTATRLSAIAAALAVGVYLIFVGTAVGREVDARLLGDALQGGWEQAAEGIQLVLNPATAALAVVVLVWAAQRRGRRADGIRVALLVAATPVAARALKGLLGSLDPLAGERSRELGASFYPSGHAAVAMSLSLAALCVAPPHRRSTLAWAGGAWSAVIGLAVFADRDHHASDVLGGFLLAAVLAGVVAALHRHRSDDSLRRRPVSTAEFAAALAGVAAAAAILSVALESLLPLGGAVVSAAAFVCVLAYGRVLERR